jgi:hypothetical protein
MAMVSVTIALEGAFATVIFQIRTTMAFAIVLQAGVIVVMDETLQMLTTTVSVIIRLKGGQGVVAETMMIDATAGVLKTGTAKSNFNNPFGLFDKLKG